MSKQRRDQIVAAARTPPRTVEPFAWPAAAIAAVALAARLVHVWNIRAAPFFDALMGDARGYDAWAQRLAAGNWLGGDVFYQAPLYPYFLGVIYATIGRNLFAVRVIQAVLGALACAILGAAVNRVFSRRAGLLAGLGLALYAPAIFFDGLLQKAVLDVLFICLMLWIVAGLMTRDTRRPVPWLWLGIATGCLALTRENAMVFVAVLAVWALFQGKGTVPRRVIAPAVFIAGLALVLMPVALRNYTVGGGFYLTTSQFGPNFYIGNNPNADGRYHALKTARGAPEFERVDATELAEQARGRGLTPAEVSSYWTDRAASFVFGSPAAWLKLEGRKLVLLANATEVMDTEAQDTYAEWSWPLRLGGRVGHFGVLVPLALLGACLLWPERKRLWPFYAMVVVYGGSLLLFYIFARYRYPLVPLLFLFAAPGLVALPGVVARSAMPRRVAILAVLVLTAAFSNWPVSDGGMSQALTEYNLGLTMHGQGKYDEAAAHFQRATTFNATFAPPFDGLGQVRLAQHRPDEAIEMFRKAIDLGPTFADSYFHLGTLLQAQGRHEEAIDLLRRYVPLAPDAASAASASNVAGFSLVTLGRLDDAAAMFAGVAVPQPANAEARRGLGQVLLKRRQLPEAEREFQDAVRLSPESAAAQHDLGLAVAMQGREADAIGPFRKAADLEPSSAAFVQDLGTAQAAAGQLDEAVRSFMRARDLDPQSASIEFTLGTALLVQGKTGEAVPHLQRALELDPRNPLLREEVQAALRSASRR